MSALFCRNGNVLAFDNNILHTTATSVQLTSALAVGKKRETAGLQFEEEGGIVEGGGGAGGFRVLKSNVIYWAITMSGVGWWGRAGKQY